MTPTCDPLHTWDLKVVNNLNYLFVLFDDGRSYYDGKWSVSRQIQTWPLMTLTCDLTWPVSSIAPSEAKYTAILIIGTLEPFGNIID